MITKLKLFLLTLVYVHVIVFSFGVVSASDEGISLILKAFEFTGENPSIISSCSAQFHVITKNSSNQFPDNVKTSEKDIKILIRGNNMYAAKEDANKYKRFLSVTEWQPQLGMKWNTITITMGSVNKDSYIAFEYKPTQRLLERFRGTRNIRSIPEVQRFGRIFLMVEIFSSILVHKLDRERYLFSENLVKEINDELKKSNLSCEIIGEVTYDGNATAKVIEIKQGKTCIGKYHIDISRGYLCPYLWCKDDNHSFECTSKDYFKEKNTSLYYPKNIIRKENFTIKQIPIDTNRTEEFQLVPDTFQLNQPISDEEFTLEIPVKTHIHDYLPRKSFIGLTKEEVNKLLKEEKPQSEIIQYRSIKKGKISFTGNSYDVENLDWIVKEKFE
ncbi:MAG: hypothetical protein LBP59_19340 [Planctomycetaceae bacterium]|jgi:hypothetical protein|nr:hypothetical protein [Planctomycetaceae bacterium]